MPILATPVQSQLLIIDPVSQFLQKLDNNDEQHVSVQFQRMLLAADLVGVPSYFAVSRDVDKQKIWLSKPVKKRQLRVFEFEYDRPVWSNTDMLLAMQKEDREQLFVCGFWLDDVVAAAALEAQPFGFNTHMIVDLSLTFNHKRRQPVLDRLNQYSIAPITVQNLVYEWMTKTEDNDSRKGLRELWEEQRYFDQVGLPR